MNKVHPSGQLAIPASGSLEALCFKSRYYGWTFITCKGVCTAGTFGEEEGVANEVNQVDAEHDHAVDSNSRIVSTAVVDSNSRIVSTAV